MIATKTAHCPQWVGDNAPQDAVFYSVWDSPVSIHGVCPEGRQTHRFIRLPDEVLPHINEGAQVHAKRPSGMRVRVYTDSPYIAVWAKVQPFNVSENSNLRSLTGFDVYLGGAGQRRYVARTILPPLDHSSDIACGTASAFNPGDMREWTIYLPNYNMVYEMYIGVAEGSRITTPPAYTYPKPVVFYGSSITQGATASRPGNTYISLVSRWLNNDYINMGFSGSCLAEPAIAHYLAKQEMSAFVFDYDHNATSPEFLRNTHKPFFDIIRAAQPDLPIILMPRPDATNPYYVGEVAIRRAVVRATYEAALRAGDTRVWYIDGRTLFEGEDRDSCTVDGSHPTDLGYYRMAKGLLPVLREALSASISPNQPSEDID
nr:SGNH/GDSL hydrolase family protein [bacterium]